jgi:D-alanyl-D-alanine carboxypeptidase (penicillin-binding protein 5/6)
MHLVRPSVVWLVTVLIAAIVLPQAVLAADTDTPSIEARSAIVIDGTTGQILFAKDADDPLPPASLTKLFTAFAALEVTPLDRQMTATQADLVGEASMGLAATETVSFQTLLYGMLLSSGNDAASTIARNLSAPSNVSSATSTQPFMTYLNDRIHQLGMTHTQLENPHGLDQDGHVSTARDLAAITMYALNTEPMLATVIGSPSYNGDGHQLRQTNDLLGAYPGLIGGKTGITNNAGYCLMEVAERDGHRIITVLLGSTADAWYADATTLLDFGFGTFGAAAVSNASQGTVTEPVTDPASVAASANAAGLAVNFTGGDAAVVSSAAVAAEKQHSPLLWWLAALLAMPCLLVVGLQVGRMMHLTWRPTPARHSAAAPRRTAAARPAPQLQWETQPFLAVTPVGPSQVAAEQSNPPFWTQDIPAPQTRRSRRPRYVAPSISPSFGD